MKNIILGFIILTSSISILAAGGGKKFSRPYGMAGCGLGSVVMGKSGSQIFAGTTNNIVSDQFFGITSGTLNCVDGSGNQVASKSDQFIHANRLAIQIDIARGNGETISGLSQIMGCTNSAHFGQAMQKNYNQIFTTEKSVTNEITDSIITVIQNDTDLMQQCHLG